MDPNKVQAILNAPAPSNAKALSRFLGQIRWHSRMIRHLADFATPLHVAVHRLPFQREALGMSYNINKFWHYLLGRKVTFHIDHSILLYMVNKQDLTGRLARWMLLLQEFDFHIQHRPEV